jgi:inosine-uridine nucleoside N-ribohydrolase
MRERGPVKSEVVSDLVERTMARPADGPPLYVVAIGAITNIASALAIAPQISDRIVLVWLGGHPHYWPHTHEFNLGQDLPASQLIFNCGVPFVHVPCANVAQKLRTTVSEMRQYVAGRGRIGDFLFERFAEYEEYETPKKMKHNNGRPIAYCKELWDVATIAWLMDPAWCPSHLTASPILTDQVTYSTNPSRHLIRVLDDLDRDAIFGDLFTKLAAAGKAKPSRKAATSRALARTAG